MQTKLTIECDIIDAQKILYSAKKIISNGEMARERAEKYAKLGAEPDARGIPIVLIPEPPEVTCPNCNWTGRVGELRITDVARGNVSCPKCNIEFSKNWKEIHNAEASEA